MKSGNLNFLEPSGPLQDCNGNTLPLPFKSQLRWPLFQTHARRWWSIRVIIIARGGRTLPLPASGSTSDFRSEVRITFTQNAGCWTGIEHRFCRIRSRGAHPPPLLVYSSRENSVLFSVTGWSPSLIRCRHVPLSNLTFRGPWIVIYSRYKIQRDAQFLKFIW